MDSILDEADAGCHWLVDPAFESRLSPPVEYLGMHHYGSTSSDRISRLTTKTSSSKWSDCFNFAHMDEELAQRLAEDGDGVFEAGQFVCVDVALDNCKVPNSELKTVPKRQIQLKRCGTGEPLTNAATDFAAAASVEIKQLGACLQQHSFPATVWEAACEAEPLAVPERQIKLQRSLSLDETSSKTVMASSLIKSVLLKKMQHESALQHLQVQEGSICSSKVKNYHTKSSNSKGTNLHLDSSLPSSSSMYLDLDKPKRDPQNDSTRLHDGIGCSAGQLKLRTKPAPEKTEELDSREDKKELGNAEARPCSDTAKATASTDAPGTVVGMTNKAGECPAGPGSHKQRITGDNFVTKIPKITYKVSTRGNKSSLSKEYLLSGQDSQRQVNQVPLSTGGTQARGRWADHLVEQLAKKEATEKSQTKPLTHKVRDLRKLVKSSYNLPFSGSAERDLASQKWQDKPTLSTRLPDVRHSTCKIPANKKGVFTLPGEAGLDNGGNSVPLFLKEKGYREDRMSQVPTMTPTSPQIVLPPPAAPPPQPQQRPATVLSRNYHTLPPLSNQPEVPGPPQPRQHSLHSWDSGRPAPKEPVKLQPGALRPGPGATSAASPSSLPKHLSGPPSRDGSGTGSTTLEQNPAGMLQQPNTGSYIYVNVPATPLCKMLFDPETGRYVQVQIPQQGAAYTGLYSPCMAAYPFLSYQSLYTPYFLPCITSYLSAPILTPHQP